MILHGNQRGGAKDLALHLLKDENDHVDIHELRGFMSDDLVSALRETYLISKGTRAKQFLYSLSLNPPPGHDVPTKAFEDAIEKAEKKLGLTNQPRAIVFHEKNGRRHCHVVCSRIDTDRMKAIPLPYTKLNLRELSRELFIEHGWSMPDGLIDSKDRDPKNLSHDEWQQAKRIGKDPRAIKKIFQDCWVLSDNKASFESALKEHGYYLAQGDRRGFVALNHRCEVFSVSKWVGIKAKEVHARLGDEAVMPSVAETKIKIAEEMSAHLHEFQEKRDELLLSRTKEIKGDIQTLVEQQKREREHQSNTQEQRWQAEARLRQARFSKGLKALFDRVTGKLGRIRTQNEQEAEAAQKRDQLERDQLIFKQVHERHSLQQRLKRLEQFVSRSADQFTNDINQYKEIEQGLRSEFDLANPEPESRSIPYDIELTTNAFEEYDKQSFVADPDQGLILPVDLEELSLAKRVKHKPEVILDILTDKQETFTLNDITRGLSKYIQEPRKVAEGVRRTLASHELIELPAQGQALYTTREMQATKASILRQAQEMSFNLDHGTPSKHKSWAINKHNGVLQQKLGVDLSKEQCSGIKHLLGNEQISVAVGLAGTGKSTLLAAVNDAWQKQERRVLGAAVSGKAVDGLQDASGIDSRTLAAWELSWKNGHNMLKQGDVFVIDEAGMVGSRQMERLINQVKQSNAKLVLVGDPEQLQPINAGTPLRDIADNIGHAELKNILRQKENWQRKASLDLAQNRTDDAINAYAKHGAVFNGEDADEAISALARDYINHLETHGSDLSPDFRTMTSMRFPVSLTGWRSRYEEAIHRRTDH